MSRSHRAQHASASPSAVTLGETPRHAIGGAKVDWLTFTWLPEPDEHVLATVLDLLRTHGLNVHAEDGNGHFGFQHGARLFVLLDDGARHQVGLLDWGGSRMRGRARLDLSGSGCSKVTNWQGMQDFLYSAWDCTITRVDLAVDCLEGEFTVDDARD